MGFLLRIYSRNIIPFGPVFFGPIDNITHDYQIIRSFLISLCPSYTKRRKKMIYFRFLFPSTVQIILSIRLPLFFAKILFCFGLAYLFVAEFVSDDLRGHPRHRPGEAHLYKEKCRRKFTFSLRPALKNTHTHSLLAAQLRFFFTNLVL